MEDAFVEHVTDGDGVVWTNWSMSAFGRRPHPGIDCRDEGAITPSQVRQSDADACDINNIMKRYERDLIIDHVNRYQGQYADVTGMVDYHTAQNIVTRSLEAFMTLPASVRDQFNNDPGKFLEFADDPQNADAMREMGLAKPIPAEPPVTRVEVVNPPEVPSVVK